MTEPTWLEKRRDKQAEETAQKMADRYEREIATLTTIKEEVAEATEDLNAEYDGDAPDPYVPAAD